MNGEEHNIAEYKAGGSTLECYHIGTGKELAQKFAPMVGGTVCKSLPALVKALNKGLDKWKSNYFEYLW